jgi:trigger factor
MATITRENTGLLTDRLNVKISKDDYYPSFERALKDYSRKASIPGFRKGMVPAGMIKKMYGASIFYDEVIKTVEKEINNFLTNEKPDIFAQPLPVASDMKHLDMNDPGDYEFPFEIGLKPEVNLPSLATANLTLHKVKVTDQMVNEEIERLQKRHGKLSDQEVVSSEDNVLNITMTETGADGNATESGATKDNSLLVRYFAPAYRQQLMGKKAGDELTVKLSEAFDEKEREWIISDLGLDKEDPASADKTFKLAITKVGLLENRELNEEFFNEALPGKDLKTEEEFRTAIREELQKHYDQQSRVQLQDQIYHLLLDTPIEFPEEFLKRWLKTSGDKDKTEEEVETEFPSFKSQLKWTLITDKIIKDNDLQVSNDEVREAMRAELMQYFGQMNMGAMGENMAWMDSYIDRMMKDHKHVDQTYHRVITDKVFTWAETQVHPNEKEVTPEELQGLQHHHHH